MKVWILTLLNLTEFRQIWILNQLSASINKNSTRSMVIHKILTIHRLKLHLLSTLKWTLERSHYVLALIVKIQKRDPRSLKIKIIIKKTAWENPYLGADINLRIRALPLVLIKKETDMTPSLLRILEYKKWPQFYVLVETEQEYPTWLA